MSKEDKAGTFTGSHLDVAFRLFRIQQWPKNLLIAIPIILSHQIGEVVQATRIANAILAMCLWVSATYIWNDLHDKKVDRLNSRKRSRPIAAGQVSPLFVTNLSLLLAGLSLGLTAAFLGIEFISWLLGYAALSLAYTLWLKKLLLVDVFVLSAFYIYRICLGAAVIDVELSPWLLAFSLFFFLSLAFVKRFIELDEVRGGTVSLKTTGRAYITKDLDMIRILGPCSGYVSALVMALYLSSPTVAQLYASPMWLWPICACVVYWISKIWLFAQRGEILRDPLVFSLTDVESYALGISILGLIFLAT